MAWHIERAFDILSKERPSQVFLSLSPFGKDGETTFDNPDEIDQAMINRFKGKTHFKVGQS